MALNVGELVATLTVDDSRYTRGMQDAQQTSQRMADTAVQTSRTVQRSNEESAQSYQQLSRETQKYQSQAETAQSKARNAIETRTVAEEHLRTVQQRSSSTADQIAAAEGRVERARREATRATERAETASDQFIASQRRAAREVEQFGDAARDAEREVRQLGDASEEAAESSRGIGEGVRGRLEGAFGGIGEIAGRSGGSGAGSFLSEFSGKIGGLAGKGGPIAMALVGVAAIGLAAGAVLANAIADGMEREKQEDLIQAKLGINEETARRIGQAAGASYSAGWGESIEENMDAARAAIQSGLLTGEEDTGTMKNTIDQLNIVAGIMGEDIPNLTRSASQAVKTGFAQDATSALDMFVKAQQVGLNTSEDFLDTIDEYGIQFKKLGLDGPEAMGLLSQAVRNGARDTDTAADALKEFSIRAVDGSDSSAEAFKILGMNAEDMTSKISLGGQDAQDGLEQVLIKLREMEPGVDRTTAAVGLFGTKAEDMGDALYSMDLTSAVKQLGNVEGAAAKAGDTMSGNTASSFDSAKRSIETAADDIELALAKAFGPALQDVANWVTTHKPEIIAFFTGLADAGFATLDAIMAFSSGSLRTLADFQDFLGATMGRAVEAIGGFASTLGGIVKHIPGMEDTGKAIEGAGNAAQWWGEKNQEAADKSRALADKIDAARPFIQGMRDDVRSAGEQAETSARLMQALGTAVVEDIPDDKSIVINSNTPEQKEALENLGLKVESLPNGKFVVTANTQEGQNAIDAFVGNNTDKSINMFVDLEQRRIGYWQSQGVSAEDAPTIQGPVPVATTTTSPRSGVAGTFADGGERLPSQAKIQAPQMNLIQWAEPETEGEAFIPLALSKRARSMQILEEVARKFGMNLLSGESANIFQGDPKSLTNETDPTGWRSLLGGDYSNKLGNFGIAEDHPLVNAVLGARDLIVNGNYDGRLSNLGIEEDHPLVGSLLDFNKAKTTERNGNLLEDIAKRFGFGMIKMADGGVLDSITGVASSVAPGLTMTSGMRSDGTTSYHNSGQAGDFSNGSGNTPEQLAFANYMADKYKSQLAELIYIDPAFGRCIKDGEFVPDSFYAEAGDHTNHVHVAAKQALSAASDATMESVDPNSKQGIANTIIAEGRKRGMSDKQIKAALMAGLDETGLQNLDYGSDGDNAGILQQRDNGAWGTLADRKDPATAVGMFYDQLAKLDENSMTEAQLAQAVQQSGTADGSNYAEFAAEADSILAASKASPSSTSGTSSSTASAVTDSGVGLSTDGTKVFVTNWPVQLGGKDERTPILTAGLKVFANGGEDHTAQIGGGVTRMWNEPETGGEGYIPLSPSKRPRSVAITKQIANRFGYQLVPMADGGLTGFGGFQDDDRPTLDIALDGRPISANKARANANNLLALGVGGLNTLLSGFDGKGNFTGKFDTGSNSPALLEEGVSQITALLEQIAEAAKNPTPVDVQVDIDQGSRSANIAIMKRGL